MEDEDTSETDSDTDDDDSDDEYNWMNVKLNDDRFFRYDTKYWNFFPFDCNFLCCNKN